MKKNEEKEKRGEMSFVQGVGINYFGCRHFGCSFRCWTVESRMKQRVGLDINNEMRGREYCSDGHGI